MTLFGWQIDIFFIYFVYGLAFFSMGLAMIMESGRSPLLVEGRVLRPLAWFGFVHGAHEWLEMILDKPDWFGLHRSDLLAWVRLILLAASFSMLIAFGLRVLRPRRHYDKQEWILGVVLLFVFITLALLNARLYRSSHPDWAEHMDAMARYTLAVPGALLAALALRNQSIAARLDGQPRMASGLYWGALGFGLYGLTQVLVPKLDIFPASVINSPWFMQVTGMPVQVLRAVLAAGLTIGLIRATQAAEEERQRQFLAVQAGRLDALEQIHTELVERERLRRSLLRHIVQAQEEERGRIARELHDETAQVLTAFSLNLAALRDAAPREPHILELLERLQKLSRQMSQNIYRLIRDLRPAHLDDLGLAAALQYLADEAGTRMGLEVSLEISGEQRRLPPLAETVCFRVAQEALTNVARHAGVGEANIQMHFGPEQAVLRICDQGIGFMEEKNTLTTGWGLAGMRERAESAGGELFVYTEPGRGTKIELVCPYMAAVEDGNFDVEVSAGLLAQQQPAGHTHRET